MRQGRLLLTHDNSRDTWLKLSKSFSLSHTRRSRIISPFTPSPSPSPASFEIHHRYTKTILVANHGTKHAKLQMLFVSEHRIDFAALKSNKHRGYQAVLSVLPPSKAKPITPDSVLGGLLSPPPETRPHIQARSYWFLESPTSMNILTYQLAI